MKVLHHALSDKGKSRHYQEDDWMVLPHVLQYSEAQYDEKSVLSGVCAAYIISDGMGGAAGGDIASHIAVVTIADYLTIHCLCSDDEDAGTLLDNAIKSANEAILSKIEEDNQLRGMGATLVAGIIAHENIHISWVGDSRCYRFHPDSGLTLLTKDHSYVQSLVDQGLLEETEASGHPNKNLILRSLGQEEVTADHCTVKISDRDVFMFCTDGLNTMLTDHEIKFILSQDKSLENIAAQLIQSANDHGGHDNITVILVKCIMDEQQQSIVSVADRAAKSPAVQKPDSAKRLAILSVVIVSVLCLSAVLRFYLKSDKMSTGKLLPENFADSVSRSQEGETSIADTLENLISEIESIDSAFITKEYPNLSISYEVRMGVYTNIADAEKAMEKYKNEFPNTAFELRTNVKSGYGLYAVNFVNKHSAQDFLTATKNENGVIIFNKFSQNE